MIKEITYKRIRDWVQGAQTKGLSPNTLIIPMPDFKTIKVGDFYERVVANSKLCTFDGIDIWIDEKCPKDKCYLVDSKSRAITKLGQELMEGVGIEEDSSFDLDRVYPGINYQQIINIPPNCEEVRMTEDKTFEEMFPSLTVKEDSGDYKYLASVYDDGVDMWVQSDGKIYDYVDRHDYVDKNGVKEHCRDIQRVREAIEKIRSKYYMKALDSRTVCDEIMKELGLEEEEKTDLRTELIKRGLAHPKIMKQLDDIEEDDE